MSPPLAVEIRRGDSIESRHEVDVAIVGLDGHRSGWGDPSRPMLARSALKPIQAIPLISTGAADAFGLSARELALACSSHAAEPGHIEVIDGWLGRLGLGVGALECGVEPDRPDPRHNTCSGNHTGFLTVCRHLGIEHGGYLSPSHPLQRDYVTPAVADFCGVAFADQTPAVDGCGIPVWWMPLTALALGWARLSAADEGEALLGAMIAEPFMLAGTGRSCTELIEAGGGRVIAKFGAEGVYAAVAPADGLGIALKCRDGGVRGVEAAVRFVLADLGLFPAYSPEELRNWAGTVVGTITVTPR